MRDNGDAGYLRMALASHLLVFRLDLRLYALPANSVLEIVHRAELIATPGQPSVLDGFLNLRGDALPVIRLRRLFGLTIARPAMYAPLIVIEIGGESEGTRVAIEADEVRDVAEIGGQAIRPLGEHSSPNRCAEGIMNVNGEDVILLSVERLLLASEKECAAELAAAIGQRLRDVESVTG